jgi:ribosomal protein S6
MTVKKERLAERLAKLRNDGTDPKELEKLSVQKLHYEIQKLEETEPEVAETEPEPEPVTVPEVETSLPKKEKKEKSLWSLLVLDDSSSEDEE